MSTLGAYYYNARFYSPATGRFMSADSVPGGGLNRYGYAKGKPIRISDPTGRCPSCTPVPESAPTPEGTAVAPNIAACAADLLSCLRWSYSDYGTNKFGIILVGGRGGDVGEFSELVIAFLARGTNRCGDGGCWEAVVALMGIEGGADAAYEIFGVRFIQTRWDDLFNTDHGDAAQGLERALTDRSKFIQGVVGYSVGGDVVLEYYKRPENARVNVAFFVIEPFKNGADLEYYGDNLRQHAGDYNLDLYCCGLPFGLKHSQHDDPTSAQHMLTSVWNLTLDLTAGRK